MTTRQLSRRQVRWSEFLSQFDYMLTYRPRKDGETPDSLTRRSQDLPKDSTDARILYQNQTFFKDHHVDEAIKEDLELAYTALANDSTPEPTDHKIVRLLEEGYESDKWWHKIKKEMTKEEGIPHSRDIQLSQCTIKDDRLYFRDRLYVPDMADNQLRLLLIDTAHKSVEGGHPGKNKLHEILSRNYFWPNLSSDVRTYVQFCDGCKRNKTSRLRYQGSLKPLPLPLQRWRDISVDMIGTLPESDTYDQIMVVVDRLSKMRHYIPCHTTMTATDLADLFVRHIWRLHELLDTMISDRGVLFVSEL